MKLRIIILGFAAVLLTIAWSNRSLEAGRIDTPVAEYPGSEPTRGVLDAAIARYRARADADPFSAGDRAQLAGLYLQRARETGSHEDVLRAETEARRSLELRTAHNTATLGTLSMALVEQHRFGEARELARALRDAEPEHAPYRAHLAEIEMELGNYTEAGALFSSLEASRGDLDVAPRIARWLELSGRPDEARALLYATRDQALAGNSLPAERIAWFHWRVGDLELRQGRLDEAAEAFEAGFGVVPEDYRLLGGMARLEAARGDLSTAIEYAERAVGVVLDPGVLALLSHLHDASGEPAKAAEYAAVVEVLVSAETGDLHRDVSLFLLDRGADPAIMARRAGEELSSRRDIYGYDLHAWALHKQGDFKGARVAMEKALHLGTPDAMLLYHAGVIAKAAGRTEEAERYLRSALEISENFHPVHAGEAERTLAVIRAAKPWYRRVSL